MSEQTRQATLVELRTVYVYAKQLEERLARLEAKIGNKKSDAITPDDRRIYDLEKRCAQLEEMLTQYKTWVKAPSQSPSLSPSPSQDLAARLSTLEDRIPKTGLLSHRLLVRVITVMCYVFFAQWIWSLLVSVLPLPLAIISSNAGVLIIPIAILIVLVILRLMFPSPPTEEYITRRDPKW